MDATDRFGDGVLVIGAGGLGCAVALALAGAGVLRLGIADPDTVALSNLQRQILYQTPDAGAPKVERIRHHLLRRVPKIHLTCWPERLETVTELAQRARAYGILVDGSDNFATRFAANDAALIAGMPLIHGAATGMRGQLMTILPGQSTCLRCLFDGPPDDDGAACQREGVVGALVGEVGWLMALEAVKLLRGVGHPLINGLLTLDIARCRHRWIPIARRADCPGCAKKHCLSHPYCG
jgi:adenylyltransferase/sulfurtransferase